MFDIDPLEVGNPMILGYAEEELEERVDRIIEYIGFNCGYIVPRECFENILDSENIDYVSLPSYLKDRIDDKIDIIDDTEEDCW